MLIWTEASVKQIEGKRLGYARVSTDDQELRLQLDALRRANCWNIYQEKRSASRARKRPELELLLVELRDGDTLVVWRLDRLARDMRELIRILDRVREAGAGFMSLTENIDLTTPMGKLMLHILGAFAQFEAGSTAQRTKAGIAAIKERGLRYGAKPKLTEAQAARMVARLNSDPNYTFAQAARDNGISPASVPNYVQRAKLKRRKARR